MQGKSKSDLQTKILLIYGSVESELRTYKYLSVSVTLSVKEQKGQQLSNYNLSQEKSYSKLHDNSPITSVVM